MDDRLSEFPDVDARVEPLLVVADLTASLDWWHRVVGAEIIELLDEYALVRVGRGRIHIAQTGEAPPDRAVTLTPPASGRRDAHSEVVITVDDCVATVDALTRRGLELLGPPSTPPWGGETRAFAWDPDGHLVEFTSPEPR